MAGITGRLALTGLAIPGAAACVTEGPAGDAPTVRATRSSADLEERPLPAPNTAGTVTPESALLRRRSQRQFASQTMTQAQLSQLLWAAQGVTDPSGKRTAPSAIALYPIDLYTFTASGTFLYNPTNHSVFVISNEDQRPAGVPQAGMQEAKIRAALAPVP